MMFLKKTLMAAAAFFLILWGGAGTQSNNTLLQGGGFIGLIIGLVVLYIFAKMAWRAMGCFTSFLIIGAVLTFILYAIGGFNGGIMNVGKNIKSFMGQSNTETIAQSKKEADPNSGVLQLFDENELEPAETVDCITACEEGEVAPVKKGAASAPKVEKKGGIASSFKSLIGGGEEPQKAPLNPNNYPAFIERVQIINGDTFKVKGYYFRLFGLDAPESNQSCADRSGRSYNCGRKAATWLRDWIQDNPLECRVMQRDSKGNMVGTCSLGQYDIGAALVNAGWAVAYPEHAEIYVPYQIQAQDNARGLWQGSFYMPWDWRKLQAQKPKIKITRPKVKKKSLLDPTSY